MTLSFRQFVKNIVKEQIEIVYLKDKAIPIIEDSLSKYQSVKIGKTSDIKNRFDKKYKDDGYIDLVPVVQCPNKNEMDELEIELIKHFKDRIDNEQDGGGNKNYTNDYWIYIVVK